MFYAGNESFGEESAYCNDIKISRNRTWEKVSFGVRITTIVLQMIAQNSQFGKNLQNFFSIESTYQS